MRGRAASRVAAAVAAALAAAVLLLPEQASADLAGRWSGMWIDAEDGESVPVTIALSPLDGGAVEATVTYQLLSGRPFDRRFVGTQRAGMARFDMGDDQSLICGLDASGRLRVRIVNPRSTTVLVLERDLHVAQEGEAMNPVVGPAEPLPPPPSPAAPTLPAAQPQPEEPVESVAAFEAGSELGVWSGSWRERHAPGGGPIRVAITDAGGDLRQLEISGIAGVTEPAMVDAVQLRSQGLVLQLGPGRDLVVMLERDEGLQLRLLLPGTVLMTVLTKQAPTAEAPGARPLAAASAGHEQGEAPAPRPVAEATEEPAAMPLPRTVADLPGKNLPLRPETVLPGPVTAGDALAEAYAGIWVGQWDDGRTAALVIADVTPSRAHLKYVTRQADVGSADASPEPAWEEASLNGRFDNEVLTFADGEVAYRFMRTGQEVADASAVGMPGRTYGIFMRAWYPARMPPPQPDPPPDASADGSTERPPQAGSG